MLEGLEPIGDGRELPDQETLARKTADAVVEQKGVLPPMHLRKKGAQGVNVRWTIETIHRGPPVACAAPAAPHGARSRQKTGANAPGRPPTGVGSVVKGRIPHQLVLRLVQPVHELGVAGGPIVRGHSAAFLWDLEMLDFTRPLSRLASASGCKRLAGEGERGATNIPKSPVWLTYTGLSEVAQESETRSGTAVIFGIICPSSRIICHAARIKLHQLDRS